MLRRLLWSSLSCSLLVACDSAPASDAAAPASATPASAAAPAAAKADNDRGHATVTMDGTAWAADRCSARIKADDGAQKLTLTCNRTTTTEGQVQSEEIKLVVKDYKGVGAYADVGNSHFARVGIDTKAANAAPDEAARGEVVTDSIAGSKVVLIKGANVSITAATDAAIDGTFAWTPADGTQGPTMTDGKFHAIIK